MLENHSHLLSVLVDIDLGIGDLNAINCDGSTGWKFEKIEGTKQSGLTGSGRSDDNHYFTTLDVEGDSVKCMNGTVSVMFL